MCIRDSSKGLGLGLDVPPDSPLVEVNTQVAVKPCAAGVAISKDGQTLVVANYYNDSITVFTGGYGNWSPGTELDLRPGKSDAAQAGTPGGEYPFWVVVKGNGPVSYTHLDVYKRQVVDPRYFFCAFELSHLEPEFGTFFI